MVCPGRAVPRPLLTVRRDPTEKPDGEEGGADMSDSPRGPLEGARDPASGPPAPAPDGDTPASVVMAATARASTAYTASTAQSAATALVRMCIAKGVFGPGPWERPEQQDTEPDTAPDEAETGEARSTPAAVERIRALPGPPGARRTEGPGTEHRSAGPARAA